MCESVFGEVESQAVEALDLPGCFRMRSHSYLRAIQAGCSQDDDCLSLFSMSAPPGPPITSSILKPSTCESRGWQGTAARGSPRLPTCSPQGCCSPFAPVQPPAPWGASVLLTAQPLVWGLLRVPSAHLLSFTLLLSPFFLHAAVIYPARVGAGSVPFWG